MANVYSSKATRVVKIGTTAIGGGNPILLQTMAASRTSDIDATVETVNRLEKAGAGLVRIAVDHQKDVEAVKEIRSQTTANLSVDLQENYRLAEKVAPFVDKIRYNPGHLHHMETSIPWKEKVRYLASVAEENDVALRIGVNCGSLDPSLLARYRQEVSESESEGGKKPSFDPLTPILESALTHSDFLDSIGFFRYCVSLKDSDPETVILVNRRFAELRPEIPLHLGVTEAGLPFYGIRKSRRALEPLLAEGIGGTLRVSLTVENSEKEEEIRAGRMILENVAAGKIFDSSTDPDPILNIVSCPSCSRVQNGAFVALAEKIREASWFAKDFPIKIAVMGCRVNGPGETDDADLGLWCGPNHVNLKEGEHLVGSWPYDEIVGVFVEKLREIIARRFPSPQNNEI